MSKVDFAISIAVLIVNVVFGVMAYGAWIELIFKLHVAFKVLFFISCFSIFVVLMNCLARILWGEE